MAEARSGDRQAGHDEAAFVAIEIRPALVPEDVEDVDRRVAVVECLGAIAGRGRGISQLLAPPVRIGTPSNVIAVEYVTELWAAIAWLIRS